MGVKHIGNLIYLLAMLKLEMFLCGLIVFILINISVTDN